MLPFAPAKCCHSQDKLDLHIYINILRSATAEIISGLLSAKANGSYSYFHFCCWLNVSCAPFLCNQSAAAAAVVLYWPRSVSSSANIGRPSSVVVNGRNTPLLTRLSFNHTFVSIDVTFAKTLFNFMWGFFVEKKGWGFLFYIFTL